MKAVNLESFIVDSVESDGAEVGTVEVTLANETRRVPARKVPQYGWLFAKGLVGRYRTSMKAWPASIMVNLQTGNESVNFGRDDRSSRYQKINCVSFQ